jgi:hypothetical protein
MEAILGHIAGFVGTKDITALDAATHAPLPVGSLAPTASNASVMSTGWDDAGTESSSPTNTKTGVLIFSKDRPYQLSQLLRSMNTCIGDVDELRIIVLFSPGSWTEEYKFVRAVFENGTRCAFMEEKRSFHDHLKDCFQLFRNMCCSCIMFLVDDLLFYDRLNIR